MSFIQCKNALIVSFYYKYKRINVSTVNICNETKRATFSYIKWNSFFGPINSPLVSVDFVKELIKMKINQTPKFYPSGF